MALAMTDCRRSRSGEFPCRGRGTPRAVRSLLFGIEPPATEDDAQARHNRDGKINPEYAGDFTAGHHPENRGQGMQFHALAHDARRRHVVLNQAPDA